MKNIKSLGFFKLYMMMATLICVILLFFIAFRDLIIPYRVDAFVNGSVYEPLGPKEPFGDRRIQIDLN